MKRNTTIDGPVTNINEIINTLKENNRFHEIETGEEKKYLIETYGCQMNEHDSEKLEGFLTEMGYGKTESRESADLIIFNTCCVRENAELKVYGKLGALKHLKKRHEELIIAVCGCMMQQDHVVKHIQKTYPHVDLIFGTHNLHNFPHLLKETLTNKEAIVDVWNQEGEIIEGLPVNRRYGTKSFVNIMYGCNNFCSYCIVPYTRGRERSRQVHDILLEIKDLTAKGSKEIMLLGQNVNSYGKTLKAEVDFSDLLKEVAKISGIERIRFMTSHPKDLSDKLIDTMAKHSKICNHIHLPLQAGSNKVLEEMNRKYTQEDYLNIVRKIRSEIPGISITTDIIIGFPNESEKDFQETLKIAELAEFDSAFTFLYSIREGTPAASKNGQVPEEEKKSRFQRLKKLIDATAYENNQKYLNQKVSVLVEGLSKKNKRILTGRTETSKTVNFPGEENRIGEILTVKITEAKTYSFNGVIVDS